MSANELCLIMVFLNGSKLWWKTNRTGTVCIHWPHCAGVTGTKIRLVNMASKHRKLFLPHMFRWRCKIFIFHVLFVNCNIGYIDRFTSNSQGNQSRSRVITPDDLTMSPAITDMTNNTEQKQLY